MFAWIQKEMKLEPLTFQSGLAIPEPEEGDIRVENVACCTNPADWKRATPMFTGAVMPGIPGCDGAGVVDAVGPGVTKWKVGDKVHYHTNLFRAYGSFGKYTICSQFSVARMPKGYSFAQAAALPCTAWTAYEAMYDKLKIDVCGKGKTIYIPGGGGGVANFAVQFALHAGMKVITSASGDNVEKLRSQNCYLVLDYTTDDIKAKVMEATGGMGVDFVFETVSEESCKLSISLLAFGGSICGIVCPIPVDTQFFLSGLSAHHVLLGCHALQSSEEEKGKIGAYGEAVVDIIEKKGLKQDYKIVSIDNLGSIFEGQRTGVVKGKIVASYTVPIERSDTPV